MNGWMMTYTDTGGKGDEWMDDDVDNDDYYDDDDYTVSWEDTNFGWLCTQDGDNDDDCDDDTVSW